MRPSRALRTLNVNSTTVQPPKEKACTGFLRDEILENDICLGRSRLIPEHQLMKQMLESEAAMEEGASESRRDHLMDLNDDLEFSNRLLYDSHSDFSMHFQNLDWHPTSDSNKLAIASTSGNAAKVTEPSISTSNNVAELHAKLITTNQEEKKHCSKKSKRKVADSSKNLNTNALIAISPDSPQNGNDTNRTCTSEAAGSLPSVSTIVDEVLSLERDFPMPSTSFGESSATAACKRKSKRQHARTAPKRSKALKVKEDEAIVHRVPLPNMDAANALSDKSSSLSTCDSDCEITGIFPSSYALNPELPVKPISGNMNNVSLKNLVSERSDDTIIIDDDDDDPVMEYQLMLFKSMVQEVLRKPIEVSDDESDITITSTLNKQGKNTSSKLSPEQASSKGKLWECPICWEELTSNKGVSATVCGHTFCKPCMDNVLKTSSKCPKCRRKLNSKDVHPLYVD